MSMLNKSPRKPATGSELSLDRYLQLRSMMSVTQEAMVKQLSRGSVKTGAKLLGLWHKGMLVLDDEEELPVLMDFLVYNHRVGMKSLLDLVRSELQPDPGSDMELVLNGMAASRYSICVVERHVSPHRVELHDTLYRESLLLFDRGFSSTAIPGTVVAGRLVPLEGCFISTGAIINLGRDALAAIIRNLKHRFDKDHDLAQLSASSATDLQAIIIKAAFKYGPDVPMKYL